MTLMTTEEIIEKAKEFDSDLRKLEDEISTLQERTRNLRERISKIKSVEDAQCFDEWYGDNLLDNDFEFIRVYGF